MRAKNIFGKHLYGQIVYPLLIASVVVGVIATVVAVFFLRGLTTEWVAQVARNSTEEVVYRYTETVGQMQRTSRLASLDQGLRDAVASGDAADVVASIGAQNETLGFDAFMVLDQDGRVVAVDGGLPLTTGDTPFNVARMPKPGYPNTFLAEIGGTRALACVQYLYGPNGAQYALVAATALDEGFLTALGVGENAAYGVYLSSGDRVTSAIGGDFTIEQREQLRLALGEPHTELRDAMEQAASSEFGVGSMAHDGVEYQVFAQRMRWLGTANSAGFGYLVGIVSQDVSTQAASTTTRLIIWWSAVAVIALVLLGGWVARQVSDPLVELATGARRIADGDFTTKVTVSGSNEVADLAESFNQMTDSLKERSESLTKKVLELATLYEMSRALGATLDLDELLGSVLDSALRIFDLDLGYVALRDRETGELTVRALRGAAVSDADGAVRSSMSDWVVREGRPLIFNPEVGDTDKRVDSVTGARAALCVPLLASEGTIGTVAIGSSDRRYRFTSDDVRLLSTIANHVTIAIGNIELFTSLQEAYLATVRSLAAAVDAKDTYTRGHSDRVAMYSTAIAESMGLSHDQRIALEMAAYLHDIGKIGVAEDILLKPGTLDDAEMAQMRHHPLIGANILKPVTFPWAITPVVRHHHEHFDGSGYPAGLRGEEIPLLARILTVADSFEAMTADRPYRRGRSMEMALEELDNCAGSQFDPRVVKAFREIVEDMEQEGTETSGRDDDEEVPPEEARAIFGALVDGVFSSFRRLGGPKLAANVESELDKYFEENELPFRLSRGHLVFTEDAPDDHPEEIVRMRDCLRRMDAIMSRMSGAGLVDHFYTEAFEHMSARMRVLARDLDFIVG